MARGVRRAPVSTGRNRRPTNWGGTVAGSATLIAGSTKVLLASFTPDFVSGETVRRMRGTLFVQGAGVGLYHGAIGAYVANNAAISVGVGSLLDPVTNVADDAWMWYRSFSGDSGAAGAAGADGAQLLEIDSKAMRRIETGFALVFVVTNANASLTFNVALSVRVLGSEAS